MHKITFQKSMQSLLRKKKSCLKVWNKENLVTFGAFYGTKRVKMWIIYKNLRKVRLSHIYTFFIKIWVKMHRKWSILVIICIQLVLKDQCHVYLENKKKIKKKLKKVKFSQK